MSASIALPGRRISDLLSSDLGARAKSKREAMNQPRTDEDQELVARTQSGDASAFDQLVIKYTPRLGLQHDLKPRGHERSLTGYFFQGLQSDPRVSWQVVLLYLDSFDRGEHDAELP